jgi:glycosyltransferase involved in cell wall biosynthesis
LFVGATQSSYFEVDDRLVEGMRQDAARYGLSGDVTFAGQTHDVHNYFRAADVFALPSRREGLPVALLEAMACGLPCVASRLPGSTEGIVDDGRTGLLVPPGDVEALAAAIQQVLEDHTLAASLGDAARDTVSRRFTSGGTADQWLRAYDELGMSRLS